MNNSIAYVYKETYRYCNRRMKHPDGAWVKEPRHKKKVSTKNHYLFFRSTRKNFSTTRWITPHSSSRLRICCHGRLTCNSQQRASSTDTSEHATAVTTTTAVCCSPPLSVEERWSYLFRDLVVPILLLGFLVSVFLPLLLRDGGLGR